jgi:hypothetical protein
MNSPSTRRRIVGAALISLSASALLVFANTPARANGAFPGSLGILLPADDPNRIVLATNFGVIVSIDGAQTWTWSCEQTANGSNAGKYQIGPPPLDRLFAISTAGLLFTDDDGCNWKTAGGLLAGRVPSDYFPDPANAARVLAVVRSSAGGSDEIVESNDGGATFANVLFTSASGDFVTGVETARSDPQVIVVTIRSGGTFIPKLATTSDGGVHWETRDVSGALGGADIALIAIDPQDPRKIWLRLMPSSGDAVAVTEDGGATFVTPTPLTVAGGVLTSFVRLPSGILLLGGVDGTRSVIFRSDASGVAFAELDAPSVSGLGQRDGRVFAFSDNPRDGFTIGESADDGQSWRPVMRYDQVQAIAACLKTVCGTDCRAKAGLGLWPAETCSADPAPRPVMTDASVTSDGDGDGDVSPPDAPDGATPPGPMGRVGCHCGVGDAGAGADGVALALGALVLLFGRAFSGRANRPDRCRR